MHFCHASAGYYPFVGGAQTYLQAISERFSADGHAVTVVTTTATQGDCYWNPRAPQTTPGEEWYNGVDVLRCSIRYLPLAPGTFYLARRLAPLLSALPLAGGGLLRLLARQTPRLPTFQATLESLAPVPDLVHALNISLEGPMIAAERYARQRNIPFVTSPFAHVGVGEVQRNYTMRHQLDVLAASDAVIVQTDIERDTLAALGVPSERMVRVGMGVDLDEAQGGNASRFRQQQRVDGSLVTFIGTLTYDKGVIHLCEAMRRLWANGVDVTLALVGKPVLAGGFPEYYATLPEADKARIRLTGQVTNGAKQDLLAATDVFVMASRVDSFGIVYLEAWAHGKPVIGARAGGVPAVIEEEQTGLLVPFGNPDALAVAIRRLLDNPVFAHALGERGRKVVRERYTWDLIYRKTDLIYRVVTGQSPAGLADVERLQ